MCRFRYILTLALLTSCSSRSEENHTFSVYEADGISIAETKNGPKYEEELFDYEEVLTLKSDPELPDSYLNLPGFFTQDDTGNFFVVDRRDYTVKVFDPVGMYVRKFGQRGEGPGDFMSIRLVDIEDDVLTLFDVLSERFIRFRTNGSLVDIVRAPHSYGSTPTALYPLMPNRQLLIADLSIERDNRRWYAMSAAFLSSEFDTIQAITTDFSKRVLIIVSATGRSTEAIPFAPKPSIAYLKGVALFTTSGESTIVEKYNLEGSLAGRIIIRQELSPVTSDERSEIRARLSRMLENVKSPERYEHYKAVIENYEIPDFKGFSRNLKIDDSGFIWLEVPEIESDSFRYRGPLYRVLSPEGEYLGYSRWPGIQGTLKNGRLLAFIRNKETDEMKATVFQIRPAAEELEYP